LIDLNVCTWLRRLTINQCGIDKLPTSIGLLTDLVALDLSSNALTSIDAIDFRRMSKLALLSVSNYVVL
jgi:Leucine-rich repeat (LRR) protein